jgi:hypothetical protein
MFQHSLIKQIFAGFGIFIFMHMVRAGNNVYPNCLQADEQLTPEDCLYTVVNSYKACYMTGTSSYPGKLCILSLDGATMYWCTPTASTNPGKLILQGDGNLCMYSSSNAYYWGTGTSAGAGAGTSYNFIFQSDRNLVVYNSPLTTRTFKWGCYGQTPHCTLVATTPHALL